MCVKSESSGRHLTILTCIKVGTKLKCADKAVGEDSISFHIAAPASILKKKPLKNLANREQAAGRACLALSLRYLDYHDNDERKKRGEQCGQPPGRA